MTEATEKFKERLARLAHEQGKLPDSRYIESEVARRAERFDREKSEMKTQPPKQKEERVPTTTIIDRYGNKSEFKTGDEPVEARIR